MPIPVGSKAPDFSLKSRTPQGLVTITLSDNFGRRNTVLLFVPLAFTGVCTKEFCEVSGDLARYEALNADIIGISVDSPFSLAAWAKQEGITIRLASDLNKVTSAAYGVLLDDLGGLGATSARAAFVIDRDGIVRYAEQTPTLGDLPDLQAVRDTLASL